MEDNKEMMGLALKQIIHADRMAADIIHDAEDTRRSIEKNTEKVKADILSSAEKCRAQLEEAAYDRQQRELAERRVQLEEEMSGQRETLEEMVAKNRDGWIEDIFQRVTQP